MEMHSFSVYIDESIIRLAIWNMFFLSLTDLPSVLSGDQLLILDPQEQYFRTSEGSSTTYSWKLPKKWSKLKKYSDQLTPYIGLFGCTENTLSKGNYQGSLFRFPLRREASRLSSEVFTDRDIVLNLFNSFMMDASVISLFLKNIEIIELYYKGRGEANQRKIFSIEINENCVAEVRKQRADFITELQHKSANPSLQIGEINISYLIDISISALSANESRLSSDKFIVNQYYNDKDVSDDLQKYLSDKTMYVLPIVGTAMFMHKGPVTMDDNKPKGREFCFLPLPAEETSSTGLPIHVNGYFMLSQDRSHLKWTQKSDDSPLTWNEALLLELLPMSYCHMLTEAILENQKDELLVSVDDIYRAIPDISQVSEKWMPAVQTMAAKMSMQQCLYSPRRGGEWLTIEDSLLSPLCDEITQKCLNKLLLNNDYPLVFPPVHVTEMLRRVNTLPNAAGPTEVIQSLKSTNKYIEYPDREKLLLLQYILDEASLNDLGRLSLLPTGNGKFVEFDPRAPIIYILPVDIPSTIFPGLEEQFVRNNLDSRIYQKLSSAAGSGEILINFDRIKSIILCSKVGLIFYRYLNLSQIWFN